MSNISEKLYRTIEEDALDRYSDYARFLYNDGLISINSDLFAKYCIIVAWCESGLNPAATNGSQQGIFQFTAKTRKLLGMPRDITDTKIGQQINFHYFFLMKCDPKLLKAVKTPEDLHFLNFKPFGKRMILATRNINDLDFDNDGWITPADLKTFQLKRIRENSVIEAMYHSLSD